MAPVDRQTVLGRNMTGPVGDPLCVPVVPRKPQLVHNSSIDHIDLAILHSDCYVLVTLLNTLLIVCILS